LPKENRGRPKKNTTQENEQSQANPGCHQLIHDSSTAFRYTADEYLSMKSSKEKAEQLAQELQLENKEFALTIASRRH
jgi:hypothetical protein